ncbi:MAG: deoxyribonuclease IV [Candidatus Komeilibacteria bacterium]|nr:deoxyribonuclease IV [Candidatus Komeilibacteria bacterium]
MKFGCHVSAAGGVDNCPSRAQAVGAEVFQFFSRSPQGGPSPKLTKEIIANFQAGLKKYRQQAYIHAPYYINFASVSPRIRHGSISVIRQELERGSLLGASALMTHLGSSKDVGESLGTKMVTQGLIKVLKGYQGTCRFLIENSAGSGQIIGDTFEEIAAIIKGVEKVLGKNKIGVCLDTAHAFASGYDLRTPAKVREVLKKFDQVIGLKRLALIHGNDSKVDFKSFKDRHEHIGLGKIGLIGFKTLVGIKKLVQVNLIIETPADETRGDQENLAVLKKLGHE